MTSQANELNIIRQSLYDLEAQHNKIRLHYEEDISRMRAEGRAAAVAAGAGPQGIASLPSSGGGGGPGAPSGPGVIGGSAGGMPPTMGPGGAQMGLGGPGGLGVGLQGAVAPSGMYGEPYYPRDGREREREQRERERERERDTRERERERDRDGGRILDRVDPREREARMERERGGLADRDVRMLDQRDREVRLGMGGMGPERLDREGPSGGGRLGPVDRGRERDGDRMADQREPKRPKSIKTAGAFTALMLRSCIVDIKFPLIIADHFSPSLGTGQTPKLPPPPISAGPSQGIALSGVGGPGLAPGGSNTPSGNSNAAGASSTGGGAGPSGAGGAYEGNSLGLIPVGSGGASGSGMGMGGAGSSGGGGAVTPTQPSSFPDDLDPHAVPPEFKKEGSDWFAIFNHKVKRVLDVSLVHTLMHERCVFYV